MKKKPFFCLTPELQLQLAEEIHGKLIQNKIIEIPQDLGKGQVLFIQAIPGMALLLWNCTLDKPLKIQAYKDNTKRYIFHYDINHQPDFLTIQNKKAGIENLKDHGLTIFSNQKESFFKPPIKKEIFGIRLYIDKKLMKKFLTDNENIIQKLKMAKKNAFYDNIDGNSYLLMLSVKEKSIYEESFDAFIKGIVLQLLGNFIKKHTETPSSHNIKELEQEGLIASKNYLTSHLCEQFPSIAFLSQLAGMSGTKFKILFKKKFNTTANDFFIQEKMNLAHQMLQSGDYNTLTEIIHELHYNKLQQFTFRYLEIFKKKPSENFIKKNKKPPNIV